MRHILIAAVILFAFAQASLAGDLVTKSGPELFTQYCASCHGVSGAGDGPVSKSLCVEVPDLTRIARRQSDFFDRERIERIIDGRHVVAAHGTRTMPVWGEDFSRADVGDPNAERSTRIAVVRLADFIWQLQRPASRGDESATSPR